MKISNSDNNLDSSSTSMPFEDIGISFKELMKINKTTLVDERPYQSPFECFQDLKEESECSLHQDSRNNSQKDPKEMEFLGVVPFLNQIQFFPTSQTTPVIKKADFAPEILSLIEKIGSEMIVMSSDGITRTTLILPSSDTVNSFFSGMEITIEEYSSAPKIFNIKISASAEASNIIRANTHEILKLFHETKFNFSVNRLDTQISSNKHLYEPDDGDTQDNREDQQGSER